MWSPVPRSTSWITYPSPSRWNSITLLEGTGRARSSKIASTSPDSGLEGVISSSGGKTLREAIRLPSATPDRTVVDGYPLLYETTDLRASLERRRAQHPGGGVAFAGCLHLAPLPDPAR